MLINFVKRFFHIHRRDHMGFLLVCLLMTITFGALNVQLSSFLA